MNSIYLKPIFGVANFDVYQLVNNKLRLVGSIRYYMNPTSQRLGKNYEVVINNRKSEFITFESVLNYLRSVFV